MALPVSRDARDATVDVSPRDANVGASSTARSKRIPAACLVVIADLRLVQQGELRLVGAARSLGAWCPVSGIALRVINQTSHKVVYSLDLADRTALELDIPAMEFKFVAVSATGHAAWEQGPNRRLPLEALSASWAGLVLAHFGDGGLASPLCSPRHALEDRTSFIVLWEVMCPYTWPGDEVFVVGAGDALGDWVPQRGVQLGTSAASFPRWLGSMEFSQRLPVTWKCIISRKDGSYDWEECKDRMLTFCPVSSSGGFHAVHATYGQNAEGDLAVGRAVASTSKVSRVDEKQEVCKCQEAPESSMEVLKSLPSTSSIDTHLADDDDDQASLLSGFSSFASLSGLSDEEGMDFGRLWAGACQIGKASGACEDAFFHKSDTLGVADGVGSMVQFQRYGVDSAAYAQELMSLAASYLQSQAGQTSAGLSPDAPQLCAAAALATAEEKATGYGASTMSVLHVAGSHLGAANLGDSGFMLLRLDASNSFKVVARSSEQQHRFNFPYQVMNLPEVLKRRLTPGKKLDTAEDCELYHIPVQAGDLIVLFTDGLSDNLHEHEILEVADRTRVCKGSAEKQIDPNIIAHELAQAAHTRSIDLVAETPFAVASQKVGQRHSGGKEDDITVVAAWVMPSEVYTRPGSA